MFLPIAPGYIIEIIQNHYSAARVTPPVLSSAEQLRQSHSFPRVVRDHKSLSTLYQYKFYADLIIVE